MTAHEFDMRRVPLYSVAEAARIVGTPSSTLRNWAHGSVYKGLDGNQHVAEALITTTGAGRGPVIPFVGLGEAYVRAAFRAAGVPMQRIRPALARLEKEFGLHQALARERLLTDGAEVLYRYSVEDTPELGELVVVRNGQGVFNEVVEQYLKTITYRDGLVAAIELPQFAPRVVVNPTQNFGQPTHSATGVPIHAIQGRLAAGEPAGEVGADYGISVADVLALAA
ncbi:hypothetical protein Xcel_0463 [Xylanimonas cellulosilytica DSM 15894]|uniref:Putative antitoxin VapB45-like DNA-binding HTH domain-containing protein n=1 Tax=Xylanimonas cellulosilytica (strain DSM 15894 / JCM 12276 / CECT 5975 / KCTC 9989 / LMG 20990 / NBRC 107835 / XIL07) TaxID=446471 RepID=D1BVZ9_XYLCX|nr:DUF433 domain-containing protein [Xylanimonas cellulosilytica]ACZ29502.1 hypothetical protein Xcel_0463 [Xylanimonas cellulosilytica DSM 15894]